MDEKRRLLEDAAQLICGDRNDTHGDYSKEAARIAGMWSQVARADISAHAVPLMMIALKLARASAGRVNRDDFLDIAGYAALAWELHSHSKQH